MPPDFEVESSLQFGGYVEYNDDLTITRPGGSGTIYYTTNGNDPRAYDKTPNTGGGALTFTVGGADIVLTHSIRVKARVLDGGVWSPLSETVFAVNPVGGSVADSLRISEVMYHPADAPAGNPLAEYIELKNIGPSTINLALVRFTDGVDLELPYLQLAPGAFAVVIKDQTAFEAEYGTGGITVVPVPYIGSLDNGGEEIVLRDALGYEIHDFDYKDGWYDITDGAGFSLTIKDASAADPNLWDEKAGWRPSAEVLGSPGVDDTGVVPELGSIVINEILAHSDVFPNDWIELHNTTGSLINIGNWYLSDDNLDLMLYQIAPGTSIPAGGYIVFDEDTHFGSASSDPGVITPFALSENGETLYLQSGDGSEITGYSKEESFGASENGVAFGRYEKSTGTFNFVAMSSNTPGGSHPYAGAANASPKVGPIVINEIMYHPTDVDGDAEYIELKNITGSPVTLKDSGTLEPWKMTDGIGYTFPSGSPTTIAAGDYFLLIKDLVAFTAEYGAPVCDYAEWASGSLANDGEKVEISLPGDEVLGVRQYIRVDRIKYSDGLHPVIGDPWPTDPDGTTGTSLSRITPSDYGNDVINWQSASESAGGANP